MNIYVSTILSLLCTKSIHEHISGTTSNTIVTATVILLRIAENNVEDSNDVVDNKANDIFICQTDLFALFNPRVLPVPFPFPFPVAGSLQNAALITAYPKTRNWFLVPPPPCPPPHTPS